MRMRESVIETREQPECDSNQRQVSLQQPESKIAGQGESNTCRQQQRPQPSPNLP